MIHAARTIPFPVLLDGLNQALQAGLVRRKFQPSTGLSTWCYAEKCVYDRAWNDFTILARGLILDEAAERVVATPFPKFFNIGERLDSIPDLPFETYEKLDGSLIIIYCHNGFWRAATKGSFESSQAKWAQAQLNQSGLSCLVPGTTYLAEAVYPENRVVVLYPDPALVMLSAYREDGTELTYAEIQAVAEQLGWRAAERHPFASVSDLVVHAKALPATAEGFVIRFEDGHRLKVKGEEYCRVHRLISNCTPLAMWAAMAAGDDLEAIRRQLPEEFWTDFDAIIGVLSDKIAVLKRRIAETAAGVAGLIDKELGLRLDTLPADVRPFLFTYRKTGGVFEPRMLEKMFRLIRPTANVLEGYAPSYAMNRVLEDVG